MNQLLKVGGSIVCALVLSSQYSHATPVVSGVSGTLNQGAAVSVSGSGFGTKPAAAPFYWNDFEASTVGQTAVQAGLDDLGNDGQGIPYVRNDLAMSGSKSLRMDYLLNKDSMFPRIGKAGLNATEVYVSVWTYWKHTAGTGGSAFIFKLVRGGTNPSYSGVPRFYETIRPDNTGLVQGTDRGSVSSAGTTTWDETVNAGQNSDGWHRSEYYFKLSTPGVADGMFQSWVDGVKNASVLNTMNRLAGVSSLINYVMSPFDGNDSYGLTNSYNVWVDDFYIDTTRARVELGDAPTLANCKTRYIQPATTWADGSVSFQARLNGFAAGKTVYLYVFDTSGNVNSSGYPVVVGSSASTQSPPSPPAITAVQKQ